MNFTRDFETHKIPEYFDRYINLQGLLRQVYKLESKLNSNNQFPKLTEDRVQSIDYSRLGVEDHESNFEIEVDSPDNFTMEPIKISKSNSADAFQRDLQTLVDELHYEISHVNRAYIEIRQNLMKEYQDLKQRYLTRKKIKSNTNAAVNISEIEQSPETSKDQDKSESFQIIDEEGAMSWNRAFRHMYRKICWASSFMQSNKAAIKLLLDTISAQILLSGDKSVFIQKFRSFTSPLDIFSSSHELNVNELVSFYAQMMTGNDEDMAKRQLDHHISHVKQKDLSIINMLAGINLTVFVFLFFIFQIPSK